MSTATELNRVILSFPSLLNPASFHLTDDAEKAARSWIQLARTGAFHSTRYGQFTIDAHDLAQMVKNFNEVTPQAPTQLPVDYDHLSMAPEKPGDGKAAGWLKEIELRGNGEELWGLVEWTKEAADLIRSKAYRFVSPSFVKDHVHKNGEKIGTTLLAAAITNHPFLEQMQALTLYNASTMGDLALTVPPFGQSPAATVHHLAELGQRVGLVADPEKVPEVTDEERRQTFIVKSTVGEGEDQFVRLTTLDGSEFGWYRRTQLAPANAPQKAENGPMPEKTIQEDTMLSDIETKAATFARRLPKDYTSADVIRLSRQFPDEADAYRLAGLNLDTLGADAAPADAAPVLSLSVKAGETFDALCLRHAAEKSISLRQAVHEVGKARPDLAAAR